MILYNYFVRKNKMVQNEYETYVMEHIDEHNTNRIKHWKILLKLNWHYRVKKKTEPLIYKAKDVDGINNNDNEIMKDSSMNSHIVMNSSVKKENVVKNTESDSFLRPKAFHFVKYLLQFDVISFDIFDTLILRPFDKPETLFEIVGDRLGINTVFSSFLSCRKKAEKEARRKQEIQYGTREVTIFDIYRELQETIGIDAQEGAQAEIKAEIDYCYKNPYFEMVYDILLAQGKTVVLTSDMYLPKEYIEKIVNKCGYNKYEKIYVSCEYRCNKKTGELFRRVSADYKGKTVVHVGDNYEADILGAEKAGFDAKHYKNCHEIGKEHRAQWMSPLVGSAYAGLVNAYIHNGAKKYSFFYEYGFIYGGIYVFGFCNWLRKKVQQENIEKIIFLARDGDIYQKIYNKYFCNAENEYVYWSRFSNMKYLIEMNQDAFIERIIKHKSNNEQRIQLGSVLESMSLCFEDKALSKYGLYKNTIISSDTQKAIIMFLKDNWNQIIEQYQREKERSVADLKHIIGDSKNVAVVDVGWTGSGPIGFKTFVERYVNRGCHVKCYVAGASSYYGDGRYTSNLFLRGDFDSYMFGMMSNRRNEQIHYTTNLLMTNNAAFEQFSQAQYPSYKGLGENEQYLFDIPEVENYEMTSLIQKGIVDFCALYYKIFKNDTMMYEISGWDAYRPFAYVAHNDAFFEDNFREVVFGYGIGGDDEKQKVQTMGERADFYRKRRESK